MAWTFFLLKQIQGKKSGALLTCKNAGGYTWTKFYNNL